MIRYAAVICAVICAAICVSAVAVQASSGADRAVFEARYQAWNLALEKWASEHRVLSWTPTLPEERALQSLGTAAVPFLIEKLEEGRRDIVRRRYCDIAVIEGITGKVFSSQDYPGGKRDFGALPKLYVQWWREGRRQTPARFSALLNRRNRLLKKGDKEEAENALREIRDMGIDALPLIMQKIQKGDDSLVPLVSQIVLKDVGKTRQEVLAWWKANEAKLRLPDPPPAATDTKPAKNK